jgi:Cys2His2 zinc finger developmental/cell cycle regulator
MAVTTPQPQQYCLRWNNHQHNLLSVFEDLLNHEAFVDVTIACDGLNLKAHKMVLSACSPYFQSMFYNTPDKHPVVFLKDVRYDEMKALLEFMYRGEVSVDQENLSSLLKVAEGLKIKGLADVNESSHTMSAPRLPLPMPHHSVPAHHHLPAFHPSTGGLLSPESSLKRHLTTSTSSLHHTSLPSPNFLGPKRKRGRPRRLSGSEAVPLAVSLADHEMMEERERARSSSERSRSSPLPLEISESEQSPIKSLKEGSRAMSLSPGDTKANDFPSEADSIDGRSSGLLSPKKEWETMEKSVNSSDTSSVSRESRDSRAESRSSGPLLSPGPPPVSSSSSSGSGPSNNPQPTGTRGNLASQPGTESESLSDMSVRGLDLLKYAFISNDGSYRCIECEKVQILKSFKNKYSFQRHAFLYHEGIARKVFPCPVCAKEFSRPDKMKQHLKQVHDCIIPKSEAPPPSPSDFVLNPFLSLGDPVAIDAKLGGLKDPSNNMYKLISQMASHSAHLKSPGGQGAS